jgi:hypothetical protein
MERNIVDDLATDHLAARLRVQWSVRDFGPQNPHGTRTEVTRIQYERPTKAARRTARKSHKTCANSGTKIKRKPHGQPHENYTVRPR